MAKPPPPLYRRVQRLSVDGVLEDVTEEGVWSNDLFQRVGRPELYVEPIGLSSAGKITTHTFCYADNELDY